MIFLFRKVDVILFIIILTIFVGITVVTMRSKTYAVGYEIAALKKKEKILRQKQLELLSHLAELETETRMKLLTQTENGMPKYQLPPLKDVYVQK